MTDMQLDLVDDRLDFAVLEDVLEIVNGEVGNTDTLKLAFFVGFFHRAVNFDILLVVVVGIIHLTVDHRARPVDQHQIDIRHIELAEGLLDRFLCVFVVLDRRSDLGCYEEVLAGDAGILDGFADAFLVLIELSGIDVGITDFQSFLYGLIGNFVRYLPGPEANDRNDFSVTESKCFFQKVHLLVSLLCIHHIIFSGKNIYNALDS